MRRDTEPMTLDDETLATAASPEEVARVLARALKLMETHALEAGLDELAFLIGVAGLSADEAAKPAAPPPSASEQMH
jgi:hypothetical protein